MVIRKQNMKINLEEDTEKLKAQINELKKVKDMLVSSSEYHLLYGKTQTIGENKKQPVRSRVEHSENISKIAQAIIAGIYDAFEVEGEEQKQLLELNKKRELLYTDIGALAHDLGHTPFGHDGEKSINKFMQSISDKTQIRRIIEKRIRVFGEDYEIEQGHIGKEVRLSFEHNEQSALLFYNLLKNSKINLDLVDMKRFITIILSHSTTRVKQCPEDLVAQVIRHADKIEYRNMDYEELKEYIKIDGWENVNYAQTNVSKRIEKIEQEVIQEALEKGKIDDNMKSLEELKKLRKKYENMVYFLDRGTKGLLTSDNIARNRVIVKKLLEYYYANLEKRYTKSYTIVKPININVQERIRSVYNILEEGDITRLEAAVNYVLGFDNKRAMIQYLMLVKQKILTGKGIIPVREEEIEKVKREEEEERVEEYRAKEYAKSTQPHTREEVVNIIRAKDKKFVDTMLTPKAIEVIKETKRKIKEETKLDLALLEQMELSDVARKYNRGKKISNYELDKIIKQDDNYDRRMMEAARKVKENWKPQYEIQRKSDKVQDDDEILI